MIQLLVPLSREWRIKDLVKEINEIDFVNQKVDVLFVLDNSQVKKSRVEQQVAFDNKDIVSHRVVLHRDGQPVEGNIFERRRRIAKVMNFAKKHIRKDCELTLVIEDDTVFKKEDFKKLYYDYRVLQKQGVDVGLVSGVQAGRWALKIVGAWIVDDVNNPTTLKSIKFTRKEILKRVDATGMYFFLIDSKSLKMHEFSGNDLAPDVGLGLDLRRRGKENVVDWTVSLGHLTRDKIIYCDESCVDIYYKRVKGRWKIIENINILK